jgi:hypothetical protein
VWTQSKVTDKTANADGVYRPKIWYRTPGRLCDLENHKKPEFKILYSCCGGHIKIVTKNHSGATCRNSLVIRAVAKKARARIKLNPAFVFNYYRWAHREWVLLLQDCEICVFIATREWESEGAVCGTDGDE